MLWIGCIIGAWSILPYLYYLGIIDSSISVKWLFLLTTVQSAVMYGLVLGLCYWMVPKTDLKPLSRSSIFIPGLVFGTLASFLIFILDKFIFTDSSLAKTQFTPYWVSILASLYGGINEEVLLRLFFLTLIYLLLSKFWKNRTVLLWVATVTAALVFGLGHLPTAAQLTTLNSLEVARILLLNGIPGIIFGWLYWSKSFYTAGFAHFVADIWIHFLFRFLD